MGKNNERNSISARTSLFRQKVIKFTGFSKHVIIQSLTESHRSKMTIGENQLVVSYL